MPLRANCMLAIHCKRTEAVQLKEGISKYLFNVYGEQQVKDAADELDTIQSLRIELSNENCSKPARRDALFKYFRALKAIESRFPVSKDPQHVNLSFSWTDAFRQSKKLAQHNIHYERSAILFNIAATLSQVGLDQDRSTAEGVKFACACFQEAAGCFTLLKDEVSLKVDTPCSVDLSMECCVMLQKLMIAQAQECCYESATLSGKSATVLSMIAQQVSCYYEEVRGLYAQPALSSHFDKNWVAHCAAKQGVYRAEALMQAGEVHKAATDIAQQIARLREGKHRLEDAQREAKVVGGDLVQQLATFLASLQTELAAADKDNNTVYLTKVPLNSDLPEIKRAPLAKMRMPEALTQPGPNEKWFADVVPDASAKALSRYSDSVDAVTRELVGSLEGVTDAQRLALRQADLPDLLEALNAGSAAALPEGLRAQLEGVAERGGVPHLDGIAGEIKAIKASVEAMLTEGEAALRTEAGMDDAARTQWGDAWKCPASNVLTGHLHEKAASFRSNLVTATASDERILANLEAHRATFAQLHPDRAAGLMPQLQAPMMSFDSEPAEVVANLKGALSQMDTLGGERAALEEDLRAMREGDNILPQIMASPGSLDSVFQSELRKYDPLREAVASNVDRSQQLMAATMDLHRQFLEAFQVEAWRKECEKAATNMRAEMATYQEVLDHLSEGLRFYTSLQEAATSLTQCINDFVVSRGLQRADLEESLKQGASNMAASEAAARRMQAEEQAKLDARQQQQQQQQQYHQPPSPSSGVQSLSLDHGPQQPGGGGPASPYQQQQQQHAYQPQQQHPQHGYGAHAPHTPGGFHPPYGQQAPPPHQPGYPQQPNTYFPPHAQQAYSYQQPPPPQHPQYGGGPPQQHQMGGGAYLQHAPQQGYGGYQQQPAYPQPPPH